MKKIICLISLLSLISCDKNISIDSFVGGASSDGDTPQLDNGDFEEPKVYLSEEDKFIDINTINRAKFYLNLSDQIVFSDEKKTEKKASFELKDLEDIQQKENLKVKVSSFCSYKDDEIKNNKARESARAFQELGSESYHSSFSIFELIPKEILLSGLDKTFYCSFVFALKNSKKSFYYNITQQAIEPSFKGTNKLSLMRETESGNYLRLRSKLIKEQNIYKILLVNNTKTLVENYHLFCAGQKMITIPATNWNTIPVFTNLMSYEPELESLDGVKNCRFFSESQKNLTGMTNTFQLDFNNLIKKVKTVDLKKVNRPKLFTYNNEEVVKDEDGDRILPLNGYFYFSNLKELSHSFKDYNSIDVVVNTKCFNKKIFGEIGSVSKTYKLAFRERFPVMSVSPKEIFMMNSESSSYRSYKRFRFNCLYKIKLENRYNLENSKEFEEKSYLLQWNEEDYGIDYTNNFIIGAKDDFSRGGAKPIFKSTRSLDLKVASQDNLKMLSSFGKIHFNFFDTFSSHFYQMSDYEIDHINLECYVHRYKKEKPFSVKNSWPYNLQNNLVSLKVLFSNSDLTKYINKKSDVMTFSLCRVMLYEDKILRYFSRELVIKR